MKVSELIQLLLKESGGDELDVFMRDETNYLWVIESVVRENDRLAIYFDYDDPYTTNVPTTQTQHNQHKIQIQ